MTPPVSRPWRKGVGIALTCAVGGALASEPAHAAPQECFAAADEAQTLRDEGHYSAARERLAVCSAAACPLLVQHDCSQWIEELVRLWPTILVSARDLQGRDLADVKVFVDGRSVAERLDGTPLRVDPGEHLLLFEAEGAPPVEQTIVLRAAEKNRVVDVPIAKGAPVVAVPARLPPVTSGRSSEVASPPAPGNSPAATLKWVFGGAAVAAFGTAISFGATGLSQYNSMKSNGCAASGNCPRSEVSSTQTYFLVSDISVGLGLASAAAATYFFLTARSPGAPPVRAKGVVPVVAVWQGGASLGARGVF